MHDLLNIYWTLCFIVQVDVCRYCICVYAYMYVDMCVYVCIYVCICICVFMWCLCVYMCVYVCLCDVYACLCVFYVCACVFMCTYIYVSVYTLAGLVGILPAYSDSYVDFLNEPRNFFKRPKLWKPLPVQLDGILRMYYNIRLLGSSNCGHRSWPVNVNVRNPIKRDTMAPTHCPPKPHFSSRNLRGFCTGWKLSEQWYHLKFQHPNLNILNQFFSLPDSYVPMIFSWWMVWPAIFLVKMYWVVP